MVRSRGEMLIDNFLYFAGVAHAYERLLPVEEELYCDFYVPAGKVYIEYWGLDDDPKYIERKNIKKEIYKKSGFNLIELNNQQVDILEADYALSEAFNMLRALALNRRGTGSSKR